MGTPDHPCDLHSRWRRLTFVRNDNSWSIRENVRIIEENNKLRVTVNAWTRTVTSTLTVGSGGYTNYTFDPDFKYELCSC